MITGLLDKNGNIIEAPYYKIDALCQKITLEYMYKSKEHQNEFIEFASHYTYFSPFFDFVVGKLGYSLINPFLKQDFLLCGTPNRTYYYKKYSELLSDYTLYNFGHNVFGFSSDEDLNIQKFNINEPFHPCFITSELLELVPNNIFGHRELARQTLNLGMIKSKELYLELAKINLDYHDSAEVLMRYMPLLRFDNFLTDKDCIINYREDLINKQQSALIRTLTKRNCLDLDLLADYSKYDKRKRKNREKFFRK